ncbi:MAG: hypothetical protein DCO96_12250 [Fluviicola sp. XM-24bin1]|nr:MAG: hypothetical protein DCO96_12250 [Fluviicola sp. XM-24bin1]
MSRLTLFILFFWFCPVHSQTLFTEVSDEIGVDYVYPGVDFQMAGGGVMVIDVNNDGWEDFYQSGGVFDSKLWVNHQGTFKDETKRYGLNILSGYFIQGAFAADFNNDGFEDFFIANFGLGMGMGDKHAPLLLVNDNGNGFKPHYLDSLLQPEDYTSATWGDFNKDGYSDLYITNYVATMGELMDSSKNVIGYDPICSENKLLLNVNGTGFREVSDLYGLNNSGCGLAARFTDFDKDGDLDLLLLNDFGEWTDEGNKCYRNEFPEAAFTDISDAIGFNHRMYGMGIGPGDFDHDNDLDYFVTNVGPNYLFQNEGDTLSNVAIQMQLDDPYAYNTTFGTSWSGFFFDYEFDGDLDLYVSKGNVAILVPPTSVSDPNRIYINDNGAYVDSSSGSGVNDILSHRGAVILDYDHDGDLDIISSIVKLPWGKFSGLEQKLKIYRNEANAGNWIGIKLKGTDGLAFDCFGCALVFEQNGRETRMEVDGGSGQASQSTRINYYGLGKAKRLEKLRIEWLNGEVLELNKLKANKMYEITLDGIQVVR